MSKHTITDKEQLFLLLTQKTTVLTPNNRLSEAILQYYFIKCKKHTIEKPSCMPFGVALVKAYEQLNFISPNNTHPTLLNSTQCQYLWRKIIQAEANITYSEGLLQSIISAWERCQLWQINMEDPAFHYTAQTRQFQQWWQLFDKQLKQHHLITEHQLIPYLLNADSSLFFQDVVWVCFDDFTPQQALLQEHLMRKGFTQYQYDLKEKSSKTEVFAAQDNKEEYQQLMAWLHLKIQEGNQRIGVVVPNLEQESNSLQRILAHHFEPSCFNISLGQSLSHFPLVAHALCWLNLDDIHLNPHQAGLLLQSPYLDSSKEEFIARSEYLHEGGLLENHSIQLNHFREELHAYAPKLAILLKNLTSYPQEATVEEWIHVFQKRLNTLGFPGDYTLSSENYQCLNRFIALFDELRQFSLLSSRLTKLEALEIVRHLADNTIFQAQKTNAPIQISGLLEASGCEFESLWIMGLTDQCLPQKVQLSAFIPPQLQRELCMPHSLPARELQFARQILQRFQRSADSIVFSYAQLQADTPNLPCSLIVGFSNFAPLPTDYEAGKSSELATIEEDFHIPLLPDEHIHGGTAILSNQAKCPFKAFAEHRLRAKTSLQTTDGLDNKERGQVIHKVMELLWQKLENQHNLLHLANDILEQHIDEAIHTTLASLKKQRGNSFSDSLQEVEYTRLKRMVQTCLEWEKQRPPFTVAAIEQSYAINLAGIDFQVRVDRLDQVEDKKWVIDYKSTLPASKPWNEERPKESQLLLYALLDEHINTLLLLQLKTGKISCAGLSEEKYNISGITSLKKEESWSQCRELWQKQLTDLAKEFQEGHCAPQPAHLTICQQCDFQNLCRFQGEE
ncbi:PD-(D/E)XK nuclease family protein [Legionella anisa]|uniref:Endonuclease n=1 Tax=Legionella anisa TaxID=28082 RepID=A0AAX0WQK3_9GAMM|nr:PD-(D/E)XK nuclease family protein [Legionella anisa]AWN75077.1 endonuclease [Legionella anisa]KTC69216.1 recombinase B [Legionella anisa]MBN5934415.1 PD-(D/E)XK nuclease family protein [Legionella anisa]MCW8424716.1 PD-(D/E)XK nuclease family protein [Legionella anisa]MCW8446165.1 PD-(D/E)XK nuclease family protein [Legionella anisa]